MLIELFLFNSSDLIKDVAVSLVPLPLNKNDNIDPAALSGLEKNIKKVSLQITNSTDINTRDEYLLNFISSNKIDLCRIGDKPIFTNAMRQKVLDLTMCSPTL